MTGPLIIGLTGHAGAGKDSAALCLLASAWRSIAFADALRVEIAAAWRIDVRMLTERATKDTPMRALCVGQADHRDWLAFACAQGWNLLEPRSPRWAMQRWGEFRRGMAADWWVRHVEVWLTNQQRNNHPGLVVTDVRMANEAQMLRSMGGWLVRVHRPGAGLQASDTASHQSEQHTALQVDDDIDNSGTLHDLHLQVDALVQRLRARVAAAYGAELLSTRGLRTRAPAYKHELTDAQHRDLARALAGLRGMVVVSGYRCELYDELFGGWQRIDAAAHADGARDRVESLWLSHRCPQAGLFAMDND